MSRTLIAALVVASASGLALADGFFDFNSNDGGFTTSNADGQDWAWNGWSWSVGSQTSVGTGWLTSPSMTVDGAGTVTGAFVHRYNFESGFDGGQVQYTTDGGANWFTVTQDMLTLVTYSNTISGSFGNPIGTQQAYSGASDGYANMLFVTTGFTLGTGAAPYVNGAAALFNGGETIQIRFSANWDSSVQAGAPNWELDEFRIANATVVPTPGVAALLCMGALATGRRRRA